MSYPVRRDEHGLEVRVSAPTARIAGTDEVVLAESLACPEVFGELYARHFGDIYRYVAARLGPDVADDLAAETFLAAFSRRHTFDPRVGAVRAWLYGIATNLIAGHHRAESRRYGVLARIGVDVPGHEDEEQIAERLTAWQARRLLARALTRLPGGERDVLLLTAIGGLSYAEVAFALSVPEGTVASRLNRARRRLTAALGADNPWKG